MIIIDINTDKQLSAIAPKKFGQVFVGRLERKAQAVETFWANSPYSAKPLPTLEDLQSTLSRMQDIVIVNNKPFTQQEKDNYINTIQNKIASGVYAAPSSPAGIYREERATYFATNFVWPSAEEQTIRDAENAELLALLPK